MIALTSADSLQAYTQHLQDYQSRYRRLDNRFEISAWILSKFEQYGFTNCSYQEYELQSVTQRNVIATIPGSVNPDTYVLIGAHYDSITNSQPMVFAPGADDNASGTAGLLEMARIMKAANFQPDCSIRFIAISAEEGLGWGSDHYCQTAIAEGQDIRLMLNMDMIACSEEAAGEFLIHPYEGFLYHCDEAVRISELYSVYQPAYGTFNGTSDSIIFYEYGFPAVFFKERYLNQRLHTNNDLIIYLDFDYAAEILRASTATAAVYSQKPMPVESLTVSVVGDSETLLAEWDAISDPSVLSYRVYCGTHIDSLQFYEETTDTFCEVAGLTEGELHYVAISTVDGEANTGNRCAGSGTPRLLPLCPASFSESPALGSITLSWSPNHELDL